MTLSSMTGFTRAGGENSVFRWNWEVKSVNNKGLDIRVKLPGFLDGFDIEVKKAVGKALARGSVFLNLSVDQAIASERFVVNEERLAQLADIASRYAGKPGLAPASVDGLLSVKGVVELIGEGFEETALADLQVQLLGDLEKVLESLREARQAEGARMQVFLAAQLKDMRSLLDDARQAVGNRDEAAKARFAAQLRKLENADKPVSEDRLAQEIAIMAVKADVQEEFDRLCSHFDEAEKLLGSGKPIGRRLDFLCQEFNREANTLCSKANDTKLTSIGVDLKVLIDQFREQVQNIE